MTQKLTSTMLTSLTASKLTGDLPAISGSSLTDAPGGSGATVSSSNPVITTNPAGGVGTLWSNSATGDVFVCQDATTNLNVWINVGYGSGFVHKTSGFAGEIAGYVANGISPATAQENTISRFAFASDSSSTDHGDMVTGTYGAGASSSQTHGYCAGGYNSTVPQRKSRIEKFTFASASSSTTHGDLNQSLDNWCGTSSATHGFVAGGYSPSTTSIDKYAFASNTTGSDWATLSIARQNSSVGHNSSTDGFDAGGNSDPGAGTRLSVIDKYNFASANTSATHGDLDVAKSTAGALSSATDGYSCGGSTAPSNTWGGVSTISKFSFASNTTAVATGADLIVGKTPGGSHSGRAHGFLSGGSNNTAPTIKSGIEKYTYASSSNTTDHGDLTIAVTVCTGHQL